MTMDTVFPASIPATSLRDIGSIMAVPSKTSSMPCGVGCMHVSRLVWVCPGRRWQTTGAYGEAHLHWRVGPELEPLPLVLDLRLDKLDGQPHLKLRQRGMGRGE